MMAQQGQQSNGLGTDGRAPACGRRLRSSTGPTNASHEGSRMGLVFAASVLDRQREALARPVTGRVDEFRRLVVLAVTLKRAHD